MSTPDKKRKQRATDLKLHGQYTLAGFWKPPTTTTATTAPPVESINNERKLQKSNIAQQNVPAVRDIAPLYQFEYNHALRIQNPHEELMLAIQGGDPLLIKDIIFNKSQGKSHADSRSIPNDIPMLAQTIIKDDTKTVLLLLKEFDANPNPSPFIIIEDRLLHARQFYVPLSESQLNADPKIRTALKQQLETALERATTQQQVIDALCLVVSEHRAHEQDLWFGCVAIFGGWVGARQRHIHSRTVTSANDLPQQLPVTFLEARKLCNRGRTCYHRTLLEHALLMSAPNVARVLIEHGAHLTERTKTMMSLLRKLHPDQGWPEV